MMESKEWKQSAIWVPQSGNAVIVIGFLPFWIFAAFLIFLMTFRIFVMTFLDLAFGALAWLPKTSSEKLS